ncbi:MAG: SusD/RagB family nutrient-binding outer membrane lipoprotein [Tannerella sp.]|jgi:hypothetical protein|nr:SusD/RagB family nutrient-binding outer membrane lipoprotein [Tannerella sp.]
MKRLLYIIPILIALFLASCDDELDKRHTDPDEFTEANIEFLFTQGASNSIMADYTNYYTYVYANFGTYTQALARNTTTSKYTSYEPTGDLGCWDLYYTTRMAEFVEMQRIYQYNISESEKEQYHPYIYAGKIIMAYNTMFATDLYGSIPYSEGWGARLGLFGQPTNLTPKYDTQKDIYYSILADLKEAATFMKNNALNTSITKHKVFLTQDIVYGGNYSKWYKYANSLRLRAAMRISDVDAAKAKEVLGDLSLSDLITDNADNAYTFRENAANAANSGYVDGGIWRALKDRANNGVPFYAPENMVKIFNEAKDPRLNVFFQSASDVDGVVREKDAEIIGMPESCDVLSNELNSKDITAIEYYGIVNSATVRNNPAFPAGVSITASDVYFLLAEAQTKGLINMGNAEDFYNKGVILSIQEYYTYYRNSTGPTREESIANTDTSDDTLAEWLASSPYKFNASTALEQIARQRWIHHWIAQPYEEWTEYRRTDLPQMVDDRESNALLNQGNAPVKLRYPTLEASMNPNNFPSSEDNIKQRVWWDVN